MVTMVATGTILDKIAAHTREEVEARKRTRPLAKVQRSAWEASPPRDFVGALRAPGVSLLAEMKRASPSKGELRSSLNPAELAQAYAAGGAAAISVLTDRRFFGGGLEDLEQARGAASIPVLRKDFILDPYQVYEARASGADALLLIMALLTGGAYRELLALTEELGMAALVEVHNRDEVDRALTGSPSLVGINNRDLHTFRVDLATTLALRPHIPESVVVVAESGIESAAHVAHLSGAGIDAMLVGTALVTSSDPGATARELVAAGRAATERMTAGEPQP